MDSSAFDAQVGCELRRHPPPTVGIADVARARAVYDRYFREVAASCTPLRVDIVSEERSVSSCVDDHAIPVRVYRPTAGGSGRGLVYIHGGAFVTGDLEYEDRRCRMLAHGAQCVVVSVDYRLAPEHTFPVPLEDCYSVLRWVDEHAEELSVDRRRLGVGGCSAGAAIAAGVALLSLDRGGPPLAMQLLLCPVLDSSLSSASAASLLSAEQRRDAERMWSYYLGRPRQEASEYASPALRRDATDLPPAYIAAAGLDFLRDEAVAYARKLRLAGVSVELRIWPDVPHAFELFVPDASISRRATREQADAIVRLLG